jgi:L-fuculose-phosphate aldolase
MWKEPQSDMTLEEAKDEVLQAGYRLVREGLVSRTWGNISCRVDEDHFVITPSGRSYEDLTPEDVVPVNIHTLEWTGPIRPSSEKGLHAEVYKINREIGMVIHTHQVNASVLAAARRDLPLINPEMERIIGKVVPCAPYALPGTKKLKKGAAQVLSASGSRAALLANHGAVCFGQNAEEAFQTAQTLEEVCEKFIQMEFRRKTAGERDDGKGRIAAFLSSQGKRI